MMAEPNVFEGRMVEKSFLETQGTFLLKIRDNTFNRIIGENAFKHNDNFLDVVLQVNGLKKDCISSVTTWENLVEKFVQIFYQLSDNNEEMEADEDDDPDDIAKIFKIKDNLFYFETPLCKTYEEYELNNNMTGDLEEPWSDNGVPYQLCDHICEPYRFKNEETKWTTCNSYIDGFCNGGELPGMVRVGCMTYFQDHKWYDELIDGKLKEEAVMHKARFEESWGDATPGVMKFYAWLKRKVITLSTRYVKVVDLRLKDRSFQGFLEVNFELTAHGSLPRMKLLMVSTTNKMDHCMITTFDMNGGPRVLKNKPSVSTSNPYDVLDDMDNEEEAEVVFDESVNFKSTTRGASPFKALDGLKT
ncbi:hypothetical protein Tco_0252900 [Tanacetum coccineum]